MKIGSYFFLLYFHRKLAERHLNPNIFWTTQVSPQPRTAQNPISRRHAHRMSSVMSYTVLCLCVHAPKHGPPISYYLTSAQTIGRRGHWVTRRSKARAVSVLTLLTFRVGRALDGISSAFAERAEQRSLHKAALHSLNRGQFWHC